MMRHWSQVFEHLLCFGLLLLTKFEVSLIDILTCRLYRICVDTVSLVKVGIDGLLFDDLKPGES